MSQKYRDRLLGAAIRLSDNPRHTTPFLEVADAVIAEIQETPRLSRESRLNLAIEILVNLMPDYEGHQGKIAAALDQLRLIPR